MGGDVAYGVVEEDQGDGAVPATGVDVSADASGQDRPLVIAELHGHPFGTDPGGVRYTGRRFPLADVRLLAPVLPSKVMAVGKNYAEHAREMGGAPSPEPVLFLKPSTSVTGQGDPIAYPVKLTERVDYEGELAVIIGRLCREVPTTSPPATSRRATASGPGPRGSTRSARSARGSRRWPTRPISR
jgi:2-keto-4-pentenoate hydratase/2-oxohepta-3-ene-1,7-dioic acid hydratase in catechol pathway